MVGAVTATVRQPAESALFEFGPVLCVVLGHADERVAAAAVAVAQLKPFRQFAASDGIAGVDHAAPKVVVGRAHQAVHAFGRLETRHLIGHIRGEHGKAPAQKEGGCTGKKRFECLHCLLLPASLRGFWALSISVDLCLFGSTMWRN